MKIIVFIVYIIEWSCDAIVSFFYLELEKPQPHFIKSSFMLLDEQMYIFIL